MKKLITNIFAFSLVILMAGLSAKQSRAQGSCAVEKHIADGYYAAIWSVVDNGDNTYTIQIKVRNDGSGGDKEISHSVIEADGGTYSDVSITDHSANFSYGNIDLGPNIGNNWPFQGFKVDGTSGFGNGVVGYFIMEYTLDAPFQDQFVGVKHGPNSDKVKFYPADFQQVLDCMAPTNNPPVAVDDVNSTTVNTAVSGNVITNDSDPDGDDLTVTTTPIADPQHGSVVLNSDGTYTYTPDNGYTGTDTFEYEVCDDGTPSECDEATVTITIIGGPTANDDAETTDINTPVDIDVLDNDVAGSAPLDPTSVSFVSGTEPPASEGVFTVNGTTGLVTFTPANGFTGTSTIDYEVCDDNSLCDQATITVTITGSLQGPTAVDDAANTTINTPVDINVLNNDQEGDGALDPTSVGFVSGTEPPTNEGVFTVNATTGLVTFTPANGYTGTSTIDYEVCDVNSLCDQATITVTVTGGGGGTDTDGDGVDDDDDDYPDDPDRAFNNYYPAGGNGTLAYEDLWPGKGDYDFNDLVVDYRFNTVTNASNLVVEIYGTFIVKAFGASLENGFGFQFPNDNISTQDITVSGFDLQENYISLAGNGLESGQSKPTVIVYDNAFNIMPHPGQGIGVNTEPTAPYVEPDTLNIYMDITDDIYTTAEVDISNFNPFIIVDLTRGREVHLPDYPPTDLADPSYFGTYDDDSDPATGRYYKTQSNLPWAINIYESFEYPIEKREISTAYNHFVEWAESGGVNFQDWYQDNAGYRNDSNIY